MLASGHARAATLTPETWWALGKSLRTAVNNVRDAALVDLGVPKRDRKRSNLTPISEEDARHLRELFPEL